MYLKSLELYGFKSFAERTKIEFNDDITCIVGPNGSGKSNITDAIRWVMGEQSTTSLRGSKMQDVIFAGTDDRRALGMAEVIITFDNSAGIFDIDYTEVEVKRKLYKNGESEYSINNNKCRLKDIRELFMDTGMGNSGYSIIGQGRIDAILNSKPEERRVIFEEASGIAKNKSQKEEVERKLKKTDENIVRLSDILKEIENQKNTLEHESKIAIRYEKIYDEILEADFLYSAAEIFKLNNELKDVTFEKDKIEESKDLISAEIDSLRLKSEENTTLLDETEIKLSNLQIENIENVRREKSLSSEIMLDSEKISSNKKSIESLSTRIEIANEEEKNLSKEIEEYKNSLELINNILLEKDTNLSEHKSKLTEIESNIENLKKSQDSLVRDIESENNSHSENKIRLSTLENLYLEKTNNAKSLENSLIENKNSLLSLEDEEKSINGDLEKETKKYNASLSLRNKLQEEINENRVESSNLKNKILNLEGEVKNIDLRISTLESMEDSLEGYNKSIKSFYNYLNKNNLNYENLYGPLANLIEVPQEYEKAITTALGGASQNLVVEKFNDAKSLIELLRKNGLGRITFLPLDNIKFKSSREKVNHDGFIDYASDLIIYDKKYDELVDSLLGSIIVVDNLKSANEISKSLSKNRKIVTLEGDIINPGGSVTGGSMNTEGSIFNRKNELNRLRRDVVEKKDSIEEENFLLNELKTIATEKENKYDEISRVIEVESENIRNFNNELRRINYLKENLNSQILKTKTDIESFNENSIKINEEIESLKLAISKRENSDNKINSKISDIKNELETLDKNRENLRDNLNNLKIEISNKNNEKTFNIKNIERIEISLEKNKNSISEYLEEIKNLEIDIKTLEEKINKSEEDLKIITSINSTYTEKLQNLEKSRKEVSSKIDDINKSISDKKEEIFNLEKDIYIKNTKIEDINSKSEMITSQIAENYNSSLIEVDEIFLKDKKIPSKNSIKVLKTELNNLGPVNLGSIRAFSEIKERYEFNKNQYDDLVESKKELEEFLKDIEKTMEEKFKTSFKVINDNFDKSFKYLFEGGSAKLVLEETEDSLEAGVDIVAELPGKKSRLLSAMSGGERSLTTVALMFALLETNPSPFVLLDEIDAALDDSNIKRFLSYLDNLDDIQFAIITHRKTTMAKADYIYGVTMEEPGVSKVLELKIKERSLKSC